MFVIAICNTAWSAVCSEFYQKVYDFHSLLCFCSHFYRKNLTDFSKRHYCRIEFWLQFVKIVPLYLPVHISGLKLVIKQGNSFVQHSFKKFDRLFCTAVVPFKLFDKMMKKRDIHSEDY